ncbi:hypothetical protein DITRI_Ditri07aG0043600 [Diplodiscus trichospermus]
MANTEANFPGNPPLKTHKLVLGAQIWLRILAIATALAATWVIIASNETAVVFGLSFEAKYSYSPAFKFFAFANAFACGFTLLSLFFVLFFVRHGLTPANYFSLFLHDLVSLYDVAGAFRCGGCDCNRIRRPLRKQTYWVVCNLRSFDQILPQSDHFIDTLVSDSPLLAGAYHLLRQQV